VIFEISVIASLLWFTIVLCIKDRLILFEFQVCFVLEVRLFVQVSLGFDVDSYIPLSLGLNSIFGRYYSRINDKYLDCTNTNSARHTLYKHCLDSLIDVHCVGHKERLRHAFFSNNARSTF